MPPATNNVKTITESMAEAASGDTAGNAETNDSTQATAVATDGSNDVFAKLNKSIVLEWNTVTVTRFTGRGKKSKATSKAHDHLHEVEIDKEKVLTDEDKEFVEKSEALQKVKCGGLLGVSHVHG